MNRCTIVRMRAVLCGLPFLLACGGDSVDSPPPPPSAASPATSSATAASRATTAGAAPAPLAPRAPAAIRAVARVETPRREGRSPAPLAAPAAGGCVFGAASVLVPAPGGAEVIGLGEGFLVAVAAHTEQGGALVLLRLDDVAAPARELARLPFATPLAEHQASVPGLARLGEDRVAVAYVDGGSDLFLIVVDTAAGTVTSPLQLADGIADAHSPPAVAALGERIAVAYTRPGATQKVDVAVVRAGAVVARYDVTPPSAGAASPAFVEGANRPMLTLVDPRAALSMAHALVFDDAGRPSEPDSLQPIVGIAAPPRLVSALGPRGLSLLFVAHGQTNADGIYLLDAHASSISPTAVIPPAGHGRLWVDALGASYGAVVVATTVPAGAANGETALVAFTLDAVGVSPPVQATGEGRVRHPAIARDDAARELVVFGTDAEVRRIPLACSARPG